MSSQPTGGLAVTVAAGIVVGVTAPILLVLTDAVFRQPGLEKGRLVAAGTLMVSAVPLVLRAMRRAGGGAPERGARWVWDVAIVVAGALLFLFMRAASPPVIPDLDCGIDGRQCTNSSNMSPAPPDVPGDASPPISTPPLTP